MKEIDKQFSEKLLKDEFGTADLGIGTSIFSKVFGFLYPRPVRRAKANEKTNKKNKKAYSSIDIATRLIQLCEEKGIVWNKTKIQKLLYIVYGVGLGLHEIRLMDEQPRLYLYGPAFPKTFKVIQDCKMELSKNGDVSLKEFEDFQPDSMTSEILDQVIEKYGRFSAEMLSDWSRRKGSVWRTLVEYNFELESVMSDSLIYHYFKKNIVIFKKKRSN